MIITSRTCLFVSLVALIVASGCLGPGTKENLTGEAKEQSIKAQETSQKEIESSSLPGENTSIGAVIVSDNGRTELRKPIKLIINKKSVFRSDAPLDGLYKNSRDLLYKTVVSDLESLGYRVVSQEENQVNVANKLTLMYNEDTMDEEWTISNEANSPRIRGTYIRCEVELRNLTNDINIKKIIYAKTRYSLQKPGKMAEALYFSAYNLSLIHI